MKKRKKRPADYQEKYHNYTFRGKRPGENILLLLRRHWLIFLVKFLPAFFFLILIVVYRNLVPWLGENFYQWEGRIFDLVESFLWMFWWLLLFVTWIDYYFDVWVVTDQRVVNIEQNGLFNREISELEHGKIQDVTTEIHGLIPTLLKFGYVYIQTAGEQLRFKFKQVPNPVQVRAILMQLQKKAIEEQQRKEGEILRGKV